MRKQAPRNVTTEEFAEVVGLIQTRGSALVGALLAAYGSCREPRETEEPPIDETTDDEAESGEPIDVTADDEEG
jgi:hypothetical protein